MTDLSSLGHRSAAVWARASALRLLSPACIKTQLRTGLWQTVWPGVYADGGFSLDAVQRGFAAVIASGGEGQPLSFGEPDDAGVRRRRLRAVACGRTAARIWRLPLIDDNDPATGAVEHLIDDVAVWAHTGTLRLQDHGGGVRELRRHRLSFRDGGVVELHSGLWITSPLRTLFDSTDLLSHEALVCALDHALHHRLITLDELAAEVRLRRGRPWSRRFATAVSLADGRAESPAETLTRLLLLPLVPGLVPQVELFDDVGHLLARFDLGDRQLRLAVEADGKRGHAGEQMVAKDRRRDERSRARGWTTERVTWFELRRQQSEVRARITSTAARLATRSTAA